MNRTSFTDTQASLHQVEVMTNSWSPDNILNNEGQMIRTQELQYMGTPYILKISHWKASC